MADILAYWHAVELFDPNGIPRTRRRESLTRTAGTRFEQAISLTAGERLPPLPWQPGHLRYGQPPEPGRYGSTWRHTVYGGVFSFRAVREALAHVRVPGNDLGMSYFDLQEDLEELFGRPVNLVSKEGLHRLIRDQVLSDAQVLYAA